MPIRSAIVLDDLDLAGGQLFDAKGLGQKCIQGGQLGKEEGRGPSCILAMATFVEACESGSRKLGAAQCGRGSYIQGVRVRVRIWERELPLIF